MFRLRTQFRRMWAVGSIRERARRWAIPYLHLFRCTVVAHELYLYYKDHKLVPRWGEWFLQLPTGGTHICRQFAAPPASSGDRFLGNALASTVCPVGAINALIVALRTASLSRRTARRPPPPYTTTVGDICQNAQKLKCLVFIIDLFFNCWRRV